MTITPGLIYLINLCDSICIFLAIFFWTGILVGLIYFGYLLMSYSDSYEDEKEEAGKLITKRLKQFSIILLIDLLVLLPIPDKKVLYEMIIVPKVANSQIVQNIPQYIDDYLKQITQVKSDK